jgi:hypothetical protein
MPRLGTHIIVIGEAEQLTKRRNSAALNCFNDGSVYWWRNGGLRGCRRLTWLFRCQVDIEMVDRVVPADGSLEFYGLTRAGDQDRAAKCKGHGSRSSPSRMNSRYSAKSTSGLLRLSERRDEANIFCRAFWKYVRVALTRSLCGLSIRGTSCI